MEELALSERLYASLVMYGVALLIAGVSALVLGATYRSVAALRDRIAVIPRARWYAKAALVLLYMAWFAAGVWALRFMQMWPRDHKGIWEIAQLVFPGWPALGAMVALGACMQWERTRPRGAFSEAS